MVGKNWNMDFSKFLHGFVKIELDFSTLVHGFVNVAPWICFLYISRPLPNKTKLRFDKQKRSRQISARQLSAEVWPRFQNLTKLLLWTKGVKWVTVLNALGPLCLWQCSRSAPGWFALGARQPGLGRFNHPGGCPESEYKSETKNHLQVGLLLVLALLTSTLLAPALRDAVNKELVVRRGGCDHHHHQHFCDHRSSWVLCLPRWRSLQHLGGASDTAVAQGLPLFSLACSRLTSSALVFDDVSRFKQKYRPVLKYGKRTIGSFAGVCLQCHQLCQLACWERGVKSGRGRAVCLQVCTRDGYSDDDLRMLMADAKEKISRCLPNQGDMVAD